MLTFTASTLESSEVAESVLVSAGACGFWISATSTPVREMMDTSDKRFLCLGFEGASPTRTEKSGFWKDGCLLTIIFFLIILSLQMRVKSLAYSIHLDSGQRWPN